MINKNILLKLTKMKNKNIHLKLTKIITSKFNNMILTKTIVYLILKKKYLKLLVL